MNKEYLEAFDRIALHTEYDNDGSYDCVNFEDDCKLVDDALERLESIDNSNPSEALECVDKILGYFGKAQIETMTLSKRNGLTIKQALLKAQEPKQYLKWEDLEFKEETSRIEVKLNETLYTLSYVKRQYLDFVYLINNDSQIRLNSANDKQFFNDLRLERVEE